MENEEGAPVRLLNVMCAICSELYKCTDTIYSSVTCGHVFHKECIMRWLMSHSRSCPQCRGPCHPNRVKQLYLNFRERTELDDIEPEKGPIQWVALDLDQGTSSLPEGAILCGTDHEGNDTYVARGYFRDDLLPASYIPQKKIAYVSYNCRAHILNSDIDVLVDCEYKWVPAARGEVPPNAIQTGYSELGETLYTGRAAYRSSTILGKVHPSHHVIYMPYQGEEVNCSQYEVLVLSPREHAER